MTRHTPPALLVVLAGAIVAVGLYVRNASAIDVLEVRVAALGRR